MGASHLAAAAAGFQLRDFFRRPRHGRDIDAQALGRRVARQPLHQHQPRGIERAAVHFGKRGAPAELSAVHVGANPAG